MGTFTDALSGAIKSGFCTVINTLGTAVEISKNIAPPEVGGYLLYNLPRELYNLACDREPPDAPSAGFTGGQCDTRYDVYVRYQLRVRSTGAIVETDNPDVIVQGSIKGLRKVNESPTVQRLYVVGGQAGNPGAESLVECGVNQTDSLELVNEQILHVDRVDGNPDNCGNPPSPVPPYSPGGNSITNNITYNNGSTNITVPVGLVFGYANVDVNGYLTVPVRVSVNLRPEFVANFNLSTGGITFDFGGGSGRPPNYPDSRPQTNPYDTNTDDNPPSIPPEGGTPPPAKPTDPATSKVIVGCLVTVTAADLNRGQTLIAQGDNPDIYAPAMGYVNFLVPTGGISAGWTPDQAIKNRRTYIPCPAFQGAVDVRGTFYPGYTGVIQPVYATKKAGVLYPV